MSHLPPKIPSMTHPTWPAAFPPHQRMPPLTSNPTSLMPSSPPSSAAPSWVDDFLDFTSARRGSHRRSMSDSVAFLEAAPQLVEECRNAGGLHGGGGFDRLDDEQLMSMFNDDDVPPEATTGKMGILLLSPSDQNSNNEDKAMSTDNNNHQHHQQQNIPKSEPGEVDSTRQKDEPTSIVPPPSDNANQPSSGADPIIDPKRVKRILANRQSAQRSRVRKLQYISELERSVTTLQTEVSALSPRVAFLDHQRLILNVDNSALKQRIAALAQDKIFKDAHQEALRKEIKRLRQMYQQQQEQQNLKKMNTTNNSKSNNNNCVAANNAIAPPKPSSDLNMGCADKEQLMT